MWFLWTLFSRWMQVFYILLSIFLRHEFAEGDVVPFSNSLFKHAVLGDLIDNSEFLKSVATFGYKVLFQPKVTAFFLKK